MVLTGHKKLTLDTAVTPGLTRGPAAILPNLARHPGLDPGSRFFFLVAMKKGGWVYIMADRYRGTMYVGVTDSLPARIDQHRSGTGSGFCKRYGLGKLVWAEHGPSIEDCIAHEKRIKRWRREWKFALIEKSNPDWRDLAEDFMMPEEKRDPGSSPG